MDVLVGLCACGFACVVISGLEWFVVLSNDALVFDSEYRPMGYESRALFVFGREFNADGTPERRMRMLLDVAHKKYCEGEVQQIMLCGGDHGLGTPYATLGKRYLALLGVPVAAILTPADEKSAITGRWAFSTHGEMRVYHALRGQAFILCEASNVSRVLLYLRAYGYRDRAALITLVQTGEGTEYNFVGRVIAFLDPYNLIFRFIERSLKQRLVPWIRKRKRS